MLRKILLALLWIWSGSAAAQAPGAFGFGLVLIDPTGLSANYNYAKQKSMAAAVGWSSSHMRLNLDHLWYQRDIIVIDRIPIDLYFGAGLRYYRHEKHSGDEESELGLRVPVGVSYLFRKIPIQVFGELGPALVLVDESAFIIDIALGGRFYF